MDVPTDPILTRFRAALEKTYGANVERVVLFGSRARGDERPDSDYDIAVFLKKPDSFWTESGRLAEIQTDIFTTRAPLSTLYLSKPALTEKKTRSCGELTRDGRDL